MNFNISINLVDTYQLNQSDFDEMVIKGLTPGVEADEKMWLTDKICEWPEWIISKYFAREAAAGNFQSGFNGNTLKFPSAICTLTKVI